MSEYPSDPTVPGIEPPCRVVSVDEAPSRLAELGLTVETLTDSVRQGDVQRKSKSSPQYPRNYAGIVAWAETLAELRRLLIRLQEGWRSNNVRNYETVYLLEKKISIAVTGGDMQTGTEYRGVHPRLARKRGPMTTARVTQNADPQQEALDLGAAFEPKPRQKKAGDAGCLTWFLMIYPDANEIRLELSLSRGLGSDGVVSRWIERILLPPLPVSGAVVPIDPNEDTDDDDDLVSRQ